MSKLYFILILILLNGCQIQGAINDEYINEETFAKTIRECDNIKNTKENLDCKDTALLQQAVDFDDTSYCDYSSTSKAREECYSSFYIQRAQITQNSAFCNYIDDIETRTACKDLV